MKYRLNFKTIWTYTGKRDYVNKKGEHVDLYEFTDDKGNKHEQKLKFDFNYPEGTKCFVDVDIEKRYNKERAQWNTEVNITNAFPKDQNQE